MHRKLYHILFWTILAVTLLIRILPALGNNFYFTMDQAEDALYIREMLVRHKLPILGPQTSIDGIYAGPGWYYFIAPGYALFRGHPFGAVLMVILLNVSLVGLIMHTIAKEVSRKAGLFVGAALLTSWWFFDTSRYAFNPFSLVFLGFWLVLLLTDFVRKKPKKYLWAGVAVGLAFNTEIAGATALFLFYLTIGLWGVKTRIHTWRNFMVSILFFAFFLSPFIVSELTSRFSQAHIILNEFFDPHGVFSGTSFGTVTGGFLRIVSRSIFRQIPEVGSLTFVTIILFVWRRWKSRKPTHTFTKYFTLLTLTLLCVTWLFFSSNKGWQRWHTVYMSPLIFVSLLLLLGEIERKMAVVLFVISLGSHMVIMNRMYLRNFRPSDDPSLLVNELRAIDWVYKEADGKGFYVYNYLPSVYDYPYQYLFWWYGRNHYGYVPCEYGSFPGAPGLTIPGRAQYQEPQRPCANIRFLIIEPDTNTKVQADWLTAIQKGTALIKSQSVGKIRIEKRAMVVSL